MKIKYYADLKIAVNAENGEEAHDVENEHAAAIIWGSDISEVEVV
jgi:hypothetical protein